MSAVIANRPILVNSPTELTWSRLEPRCRSDDFSNGLKMPVADPLWMLGRQFQFGEFQGEDTGSPIRTVVSYSNEKIKDVKLGTSNSSLDLENAPPLETLVEREPVYMDWRTRVQIGQQLERLLQNNLSNSAQGDILAFRQRYQIKTPVDEQLKQLDRATRRFITLMAGRVIDGGSLMDELDRNSSPPPLPSGIVVSDEDVVLQALKKLLDWFNRLYCQPSPTVASAWIPENLDYKFKVNCEDNNESKTTLVAPSYRNGRLDWYTLSVAPAPEEELEGDETPAGGSMPTRPGSIGRPDMSGRLSEGLTVGATPASRIPEISSNIRTGHTQDNIVTEEFLPTAINFYGQPHTRLYEIEDSLTDFGDLDVATTDLGKLMLMEFAMVYGDDWFRLPLTLPLGSLTKIRALEVTDVFGVTTPIPRATATGESALDRWELFGLSSIDNPTGPATEDLFFLPPAIGFRDESPAIEEVRFMRDEMANMVFALQRTIPNGVGDPMGGFELYTELKGLGKESELRARLDQMRTLITRLQELNEQIAAITISETGTLESLQTQAGAVQEQINELSSVIATASESTGASAATESTSAEDTAGLPQYRLSTTVPPDWIPYVPVRVSMGDLSIKLRRADILRPGEEITIDTTSRIFGPDSSSSGLEWINEESISRAGVKVQLTKQRVRWIDGETYVWLGKKVLTGKGEGRSGLGFDVMMKN